MSGCCCTGNCFKQGKCFTQGPFIDSSKKDPKTLAEQMIKFNNNIKIYYNYKKTIPYCHIYTQEEIDKHLPKVCTSFIKTLV